MPAQNCLGLDNEERRFPVLQPACEQDEKRTIEAREARSVDRAVENDKLLAEQGVFDDQLPLASGQVTDAPDCE